MTFKVTSAVVNYLNFSITEMRTFIVTVFQQIWNIVGYRTVITVAAEFTD